MSTSESSSKELWIAREASCWKWSRRTPSNSMSCSSTSTYGKCLLQNNPTTPKSKRFCTLSGETTTRRWKKRKKRLRALSKAIKLSRSTAILSKKSSGMRNNTKMMNSPSPMSQCKTSSIQNITIPRSSLRYKAPTTGIILKILMWSVWRPLKSKKSKCKSLKIHPPWKTSHSIRSKSIERSESAWLKSRWARSGWNMLKDTSNILGSPQVFARSTRWWFPRKKTDVAGSNFSRNSQPTVVRMDESTMESKSTRTPSKVLKILKTSLWSTRSSAASRMIGPLTSMITSSPSPPSN